MPTSSGSLTDQRPVVLIGLMGSGKSSVGPILASALDLTFVDTDSVVEESSGMSIDEIFDRETEAGFRRREKEAVLGAMARSGVVIACGGGAVLDPELVEIMRAAGLVIFLEVSPEVAYSRVVSGEGRPLLGSGTVREDLESLARSRRETYRQASHHIVDASGSIEETVNKIMDVIR